MSLTVRQLTEIESLRTQFLAGRDGGDRPVTWAHSTELPDPWNWLGPGDLLLTNGYNVPTDPDAQVKLLEELNNANISGIAFSGRPDGPVMTPAALEAADTLQFPVLETEYSVPWVTLSRIVVESNTQKASARLIKVLRQYDVLRRTYHSGAASQRLLEQLGKECECVLRVLNVDGGAAVLPAAEPMPGELREAVLAQLRDRLPLPAFTRVVVNEDSTLVLPVTSDGRSVLVASATHPENDLDLVVLQHAATIVGLEVERRIAMASRRRASGSRLMQQLITGVIDAEAALDGLKAFGLAERPWRIICWGIESQLSIEDMQARLAEARVPSLIGASGAENVALVPASVDEHLAALAKQHPGLLFGASLPVQSVSRMGDAVREARWALETSRTAKTTLTVYGESGPLFLPRSIAEGEAAVERILGPIISYDSANDGQLLNSLVAYLDANRSWQEAASALGVHRQTLMYRMRRIEEITERKLHNLSDQTELYLAIRIWKMLQSNDDASRLAW